MVAQRLMHHLFAGSHKSDSSRTTPSPSVFATRKPKSSVTGMSPPSGIVERALKSSYKFGSPGRSTWAHV